jgi:hypothetical protein
MGVCLDKGPCTGEKPPGTDKMQPVKKVAVTSTGRIESFIALLC